MKLINGREQQLTQPDIVMGAMENAGLLSNENLQYVYTRMMFPQTVTIQINNTVFLYNAKEKDGALSAICSVFNIDTKELFARNIFEFFKTLQDRDIQVAIMSTSDVNFLHAVLSVAPDLKKHNIAASAKETDKDGAVMAVAVLDEKKYTKKKRRSRRTK
tara:strand:+ start:1840 stop:2319 length:480 start_codon:yes stop_codon:yes gene_type:complete